MEARGNMMENYYHLFANGDDAKNFITNEDEFRAAMNRVAVCSHLCHVKVVVATIEDSHPHFLLKGTLEEVNWFAEKYTDLTTRYISRHRGSIDGVALNLEICPISDEAYLRNAAAYIIVQPTKDGKAILPHDYLYGTGALYFRQKGSILPWDHDYNGHLHEKVELGTLPIRDQWRICNTKEPMPSDWIISGGFIHPACYVDVESLENIYKTHNCYRAFTASSKSQDEIIRSTMASIRGIILDDIEARRICAEQCLRLFSKHSTKTLTMTQRLNLAQELRRSYRMSFRQLSTMVKIPELELRKYIR